MKREDLYDGISGIRPEFLREAESYKAERRFYRIKWIAAAASLCVIAVGVFWFVRKAKVAKPFLAYAYEMNSNGELSEVAVEVYQGKQTDKDNHANAKDATVSPDNSPENSTDNNPENGSNAMAKYEPMQLEPLALTHEQLPGVHFYLIAIEMDDKEAKSTFCGLTLPDGVSSKVMKEIWKEIYEMDGISVKGMRYFVVAKEEGNMNEPLIPPEDEIIFEFRLDDGSYAYDKYSFRVEEDEPGKYILTMKYTKRNVNTKNY